MKIFIGADSPELTGKLAKRFGHANYYLVFNSKTKAFKVILNSEHDEKHQILIDAVKNGVETFIVGNIGPFAFNILNNGKTEIYLARKMSVNEAIEKLNNGELEFLTEPTLKKSLHQH